MKCTGWFSSLLTAAFLSAPSVGFAQIASPTNAGQNAGNNASASSTSTFSTPNFSRPITVSLVAGVIVGADGLLEASPELEEELIDALEGVVGRRLPGLQPVLIPSTVDRPLAATSFSDQVVFGDSALRITTDGGETLELRATAALRAYVDQALQAGLTPSSVGLGAQLVAIGAPVDATLELTASLQGLASQPTLNALARGIAAFNAIVNGASPALRAQLSTSPVFIATSNVLRAARNALPAQR